jgi:hypothetical protein
MAAHPREVPWLAEARALYAQGESFTDIAARFDTSTTSVHRAFCRNQVPARSRTEAHAALSVRLRAGKINAAGETLAALEARNLLAVKTLTHGTNGHLDRGIARLEAQIADDRARGYSAFTDGGH